MFEGKLPRPSAFRPLDDEQVEAESLHSLSWDDLLARLSAARELHATLRLPVEEFQGSFDAGSARRMAAQGTGKPLVNLDSSSNGKGAKRTAESAGHGSEPDAPTAPRGSK